MALALDQQTTIVAGTTTSLTSGSFTTTVASEIVLAFCTADGFFNGSGGNSFSITDNKSQTWTLLKRERVKSGTCEIWYAILSATQSSMTVTATTSAGSGDEITLEILTLSGQGTSPIGATGVASITSALASSNLTTTINNSWVFALYSNSANNPDDVNYIAGSSQTIIGEHNGGVNHGGAASWRQSSTTVTSGTNVTMNLTTPSSSTGDMVLFEILPFVTTPTGEASWLGNTISQPLFTPIDINLYTLPAQSAISQLYPIATSMLQDSFGGGFDATKWVEVIQTGSISFINGTVQFTSSTNSGYNDLRSVKKYDLTGSYIYAQLVSAGNQSIPSLEANLYFWDNISNSKLWFDIGDGGNIKAWYNVNGSGNVQVASASYNSATMQWFRIRENSGTIYWDYSADGTNWINFISVTDPFDITFGIVAIQQGTYQNESLTSTVIWDSFNITPFIPSAGLLLQTVSQPFFTPYNINQISVPSANIGTYFKPPLPPTGLTSWLNNSIAQPYFTPYDVNRIVWPASEVTYFKAPNQIIFSNGTIAQPVGNIAVFIPGVMRPILPPPIGIASWLSTTISQPFFEPWDENYIVWPVDKATYFKALPLPIGVGSWLNSTISQPYFTSYDVNQLVWPASESTYFKVPNQVAFSSGTISQPIGNIGVLIFPVRYVHRIVSTHSTLALKTNFQATANENIALSTSLISTTEERVALKTTLELTNIKGTVAVRTTLQTTFKSSTVSLLTTLETHSSKSTVSLLTTLNPNLANTVALATRLEVFSAYRTLALKTILETKTTHSTLSLTTSLEDVVKNTIALSTTLEAVIPYYANLDQQNLTDGTNSAFGQFNNIRYQGFGFIPNRTGYVTKVAISRNKGSQGLNFYFDNAGSNSIPLDPPSNALYSFTVPNSQITGGYQVFTLPSRLYVIAGQQYCVYVAPWNTGLNIYADDLENEQYNTGSYSDGQVIINTNGVWSGNPSLTPVYSLWIQQSVTVAINTNLEEKILSTVAIFTDFNYQGKSTIGLVTTLQIGGELYIGNPIGLLLGLTYTNNNNAIAIQTILEESQQPSTIAILTTLQEHPKYGTVAINTTLETIKQSSTVALLTILQTTFKGSTIALKTRLQVTPQYSTIAIETTLETTYKDSTVAINTKLETVFAPSTIALQTILSKPALNTIALLTILQTSGKVSTIALFTSFQSVESSTPIAIYTTLEEINIKSTVALSTTLQVIPQYSTVALKTTLEEVVSKTIAVNTRLETAREATLALKTTLQSANEYSTVALQTILQVTPQYKTVALLTTFQSTSKYSTVALKTTLQSAQQYSTFAIKTTLETIKQFSTVALQTILESGKKVNTVALQTILQVTPHYSTVAVKTSLEGNRIGTIALATTLIANKRSTVAILSLFGNGSQLAVAVKTTLNPALRFSTVAISANLIRLSTSSPIAINTIFVVSVSQTVAIRTTLLYFIGYENDNYTNHLGFEGSSEGQVPRPFGGYVNDGSRWPWN